MAELFYTDEFKKNLKILAKKYPHIKQDLAAVIEQLSTNKIIGDRISQTGLAIFKLRIANTDTQKGKSAGYRLLYWLKTPEKTVLLTIYSKSERGNITTNEIKQIISSTV